MPRPLSILNLVAVVIVGVLLVGVSVRLVRHETGRSWSFSRHDAPAADMNNANNPPGGIVIKKAAYGDLPNGGQTDITQAVADMVKGGTTTITAGNASFGDPAPGVVKKMQIDYTIDGKDYSKTVNENESLTVDTNN